MSAGGDFIIFCYLHEHEPWLKWALTNEKIKIKSEFIVTYRKNRVPHASKHSSPHELHVIPSAETLTVKTEIWNLFNTEVISIRKTCSTIRTEKSLINTYKRQ